MFALDQILGQALAAPMSTSATTPSSWPTHLPRRVHRPWALLRRRRSGERVGNDATLAGYQAMAVAQAQAGARARSQRLDGRPDRAAIRAALDEAGHTDTAALLHEYASAFYGPFRDATWTRRWTGISAPYQQDPANRAEALRG